MKKIYHPKGGWELISDELAKLTAIRSYFNIEEATIFDLRRHRNVIADLIIEEERRQVEQLARLQKKEN